MPAAFVETNVADARSVQRAVPQALDRFGRLDCVVNNAGVLTPGPLARLTDRELDRTLAVNLRGRCWWPVPRSACGSAAVTGCIINVASQLGKHGVADYVTHGATKFGVVGMTQAPADEPSQSGVRAWAVCPGLVDTTMARRAVGVSGRARAASSSPRPWRA